LRKRFAFVAGNDAGRLMMSHAPRFHRLAVNDLRREAADAVSMTFAIPKELEDDYGFTPGQYLTLRTTMDGEEVRRSYSICSGPDDGELRIAVKKVDGGAFSNWAADELKPGDELDVMTPTGRFGVAHAPDAARIYVGFAAGSGITPILSIVKGVLAREPNSRFFLFYGNRSTTGMLFLEELEELKDRFMQRLSLFHVISGEEQDIPILHGRLDGEKVRVLLRSLVPAASVDHVLICGPAGMSEDIEATCRAIGIAEDRIHVERFVSECNRSVRAAKGDGLADHRRQAPRGAGRGGGIHSRRRVARRHGSAVRLQGRHVLDLPRQAGRGRRADGSQLFAGAMGIEGGIHPDLPGAAVFGQGGRGLRPRLGNLGIVDTSGASSPH
jgi:ring-1,2-phenylacetyl-CoA epoxidase subunit PaaE